MTRRMQLRTELVIAYFSLATSSVESLFKNINYFQLRCNPKDHILVW